MRLSALSLAITEQYGRSKFRGAALHLDASRGQDLADLVAFIGDGNRTYFDAGGVLRVAPANKCPPEYDPATGVLLGWSVWESRTNLLTYSDTPSNAAHFLLGATKTAGLPSPDGGSNLVRIVENSSPGQHGLGSPSAAVTAGTVYTGTRYLRAGTRGYAALILQDSTLWPGSVNPAATFNLTTGTVTSVVGTSTSASCTHVGGGLYLCRLTATPSISGNTALVTLLHNGTSVSYTGNGSYIEAWAAQLEAGSFPTPLIITAGSAVTRAAPTAAVTGSAFSALWSPLGGAFLVESSSAGASPGPAAVVGASDGTTNNRLMLRRSGTLAPTAMLMTNVVGGSVVGPSTTVGATVAAGVLTRQALAFSAAGLRGSVDGSAIVAASNAALPVVDRMELGYLPNSGRLNGHIKRVAYWPRALSDSQLQALTR